MPRPGPCTPILSLRALSRLAWLVALLLSAGCAAAPKLSAVASPEADYPQGPQAGAEEATGLSAAPPAPPTPTDATASVADSNAWQPSPNPQPPRQLEISDASPIAQLLVYTAQLALSVLELDKSLASVEAIAREMGGMLAQRTDAQAVIRVPSSKFFETLSRIEALGEPLHKSVQVQDVSEEFRDLSLRLKNARQVRDRLAALLANAKTIEESLKVERELERLSAEIERMEGRLKFLRDRAALSTITVSFQLRPVETMRSHKLFRLPFPWLSDLGLGHLLRLH